MKCDGVSRLRRPVCDRVLPPERLCVGCATMRSVWKAMLSVHQRVRVFSLCIGLFYLSI